MNGTERHVSPGRPPWRLIGWGTAAALLLVPLVAMRFTDEVKWDETDFLFAGILFATVGGLFELAVRASSSLSYRAGVAAALAVSLMIVWANAAVGMIGSEDNPFNLWFLALIAAALIGGIAVRFRAGGMAVVMLAGGIAQIAVAMAGRTQDARGAILSTGFALLWFLSAALFRLAAGGSRLKGGDAIRE